MNSFNPLVSIIIPVYNGSNYIREALDSALGQTYKNIEIIVVNDGSVDNTEEIVLSYADKVKYFAKENGGVATALNLAIQNANGEYISWLSHDDVYLPNKIERQIEELNKLEDKSTILYSDYACINPKGKILYEIEFLRSHEKRKLNTGLYTVFCGLLNGCSLLIVRTLFFKIAFFDESLKHTQDYDLWFKFFNNNCPIYHIPEILIQSRIHKSQDSGSIDALIECNSLWIKFLKTLKKKEDFNKIDGNEFFVMEKVYENLKNNNYQDACEYIENKLFELKINHLASFSIPPKISTIVTCFNQAYTIEKAINSIIAQDYENFEVIVVDDGSTDKKTLELLSSYTNHPNVTIYFTENKGVSAARNYGLSKTNGDFIQFLDGDDELLPNKFKYQIEHFCNKPYIDVSYSSFHYFNIDTNQIQPASLEQLFIDKYKQFEYILYYWQIPLSIALHSFLFKRECLVNIFFPENLKVNEDYLFLLKIAFCNYKFDWLEKDLCRYNIKSLANNNINCSQSDYFKVVKDVIEANLFIQSNFQQFYDSKFFDYTKIHYLRRIINGIFLCKFSDPPLDKIRKKGENCLKYVPRNKLKSFVYKIINAFKRDIHKAIDKIMGVGY